MISTGLLKSRLYKVDPHSILSSCGALQE